MPIGIVTQMTEESIYALTSELKHLRQQRDDLQKRDSQLITENRALVKDCLVCRLLAKIPAVKPEGQTMLSVTFWLTSDKAPVAVDITLDHTCPQ